MSDVALIADRLAQAERDRIAIPPVRNAYSATDETTAYTIQQHNTDRALRSGRRLVGRKIGLTSPAVQKQLGVDQPDYGALFSDMIVEDGGSVLRTTLIQPKVEAEIAFVLKHDLKVPDLSVDAVAEAIDYAVAAIEIVDSRIERWDIRLFDTIADNASSALVVLGNERCALSELDLELGGMLMTCDGETVSMGLGAACLGNPLNATLWLARRMIALEQPLKAGDLVMTGALGPMAEARAGDRFTARIQRLGEVSVTFTGEAGVA